MKDKLKDLYSSDNNYAYKVLQELELETIESNELYDYFDDLIDMLKSKKTFIKIRGFRLICSLSIWDIDNKINNNINTILNQLDDNNAVVIRQSLEKVPMILMYKTELASIIEDKLRGINLSKYKETMQSLIKKDIDNILKNI